MMRPMARKRSHQAKLVMRTLLDAPAEETYGLEVVRASGVPAGSAYAILRRFEDEGLLEGRWEQIDEGEEGRPPRRYYRLNAHGRRVANRETAEHARALKLLTPGWGAR
jgi:PadR family transcriptional regulator, regulatory protein PadR